MEFKNSLKNSDRKMHGTSCSKESPPCPVQEWELVTGRTESGIWHKDAGTYLEAGEEEE